MKLDKKDLTDSSYRLASFFLPAKYLFLPIYSCQIPPKSFRNSLITNKEQSFFLPTLSFVADKNSVSIRTVKDETYRCITVAQITGGRDGVEAT